MTKLDALKIVESVATDRINTLADNIELLTLSIDENTPQSAIEDGLLGIAVESLLLAGKLSEWTEAIDKLTD